VHHSQELALKM
jgi:hypothetical protein